ncbi:hypothetical protein TRFO_07006 [Tritrichomonas foetus]|uniref:Uncharacterized protein n=1 Tax=Tritrichomonas foetus TaxID=1144522 RepID=A0A1J4JZB5_9EUKA|nr:hypothetical protein TRFO_07006 [Tritrichomonas foetus]|eukprot:OHT02597.1 hypothetical protein TRFO_07006 [Tritrichomonas foetus]
MLESYKPCEIINHLDFFISLHDSDDFNSQSNSYFSDKNMDKFDYFFWYNNLQFASDETTMNSLLHDFLIHHVHCRINFTEKFDQCFSQILYIISNRAIFPFSARIKCFRLILQIIYKSHSFRKYLVKKGIIRLLTPFIMHPSFSFIDDTVYSIQIVSSLTNISNNLNNNLISLILPKLTDIFTLTTLCNILSMNNKSMIHSLCNVLINITHQKKLPFKNIHSFLLFANEIITHTQNEIIINKVLTFILNLSKNKQAEFSDFVFRGIEIKNKKMNLIEFMNDALLVNKEDDKILILKIFRRLLNQTNYFYFNFKNILLNFSKNLNVNSKILYYTIKLLYHFAKYVIQEENKVKYISNTFSHSKVQISLNISNPFPIQKRYNIDYDILHNCEENEHQNTLECNIEPNIQHCEEFKTENDDRVYSSIMEMFTGILKNNNILANLFEILKLNSNVSFLTKSITILLINELFQIVPNQVLSNFIDINVIETLCLLLEAEFGNEKYAVLLSLIQKIIQSEIELKNEEKLQFISQLTNTDLLNAILKENIYNDDDIFMFVNSK